MQDVKDSISIVLVNPKRSSNVGAAARAMKCMGFKNLVLVEPRCQIDRFAFNLATGSGDILENARVYLSLEEAVRECGLILGTTRRKGKRRFNYVTPGELVESVIPGHLPSRIALLFGPEDYGLGREHLQLCQYLITIPTGDEFGSLNLAQAVMILCYEIFTGLRAPGERATADPAEQEDLERLYAILEETFIEIQFPSRKKVQHESGHLKAIVARSQLSKWEVEFFLGFLRHLRYMGKKLGFS